MASIFLDEIETELLKSQELQPFLWILYNDDIFYIDLRRTKAQLINFNNFHSDTKFTNETSSCTVNFLDLTANLINCALHTDL